MTEISIFNEVACEVGESPIWHPLLQQLAWVDATKGVIYSSGGGELRTPIRKVHSHIGSIGPTSDGFVIAAGDKLFRWCVSDDSMRCLSTVNHRSQGVFLNDGKCDNEGNYVCGSATFAEDSRFTAKIWLFHPDGRHVEILDGISIANSICFSPAYDIIYIGDSASGRIDAFEYDASGGKLRNRVLTIDCKAETGSMPDGATVDEYGNIWVALVETGQLACFDSSGHLQVKIDLPVPHPTCPAFGGQQFTSVFVTSLSTFPDGSKSIAKNSGRLIEIHALGVCGRPEPLFGASRQMNCEPAAIDDE